MNQHKLLELQKLKIAVIGDVMLDRYIDGRVSRVSPEAPIPILEKKGIKNVPGGAANVCRNLYDFGADFKMIGVVGENDKPYLELKQLFCGHEESLAYLVECNDRPTSTKTRVVGNGQQIVRIDDENTSQISGVHEQQVIKNIHMLRGEVDAVIVADYAKGVVTAQVVDALKELASDGVIVAVDPHPNNRQDWSGVTILKPNLKELRELAGVDITLVDGQDPLKNVELSNALDILIERWHLGSLLVTLSEHGMVYVEPSGDRSWVPTQAAEVFDVSGAGDTAITFFTLALAAGWCGKDATQFANRASGLVVCKLGTASVSFDELKRFY
ncbi:MAG: D-glycero-beta-D-manno-heptose-7-phosphate kinase [Verrucomicrobiae bacterium]|nr:D-glycero-beta-D-manno-heptose-7-phosphate kinase [Verrucomicrobiae bacterium]NNJ42526.1 D-glycero-beta-D-manno-heptose-7-phosphate kinase [Akkermansiaceae bacterium]